MLVRAIEFAWIVDTLEHPESNTPDPRDPPLKRSFRSIEQASGRVLRVVHRAQGEDIVVVTVFFDRGAKP